MNILQELELLDYSYEFSSSEDEIRCACPFHDDSSPSLFVNTKKKVFHCQSCSAKGGIYKLLAKIQDKPVHVVRLQLNEKYGVSNEKLIKAQTIERYHRQLWNDSNEDLRNELYKRAVTDEMIRSYRLGESNGRITIPIKNSEGLFVNIRRYSPGAPTAEKMKNVKGRGQMRWYPYEQLSYDAIVICGGEVKSIVAASQLNKHNWGAACLTAGESNINPALLSVLEDKEVVVCMDVDEAGKNAANNWCRMLYKIVPCVKYLELPIDIEKGDINDFAAEGGDLFEILDTAIIWEPSQSTEWDDDEDPIETTLSDAMSSKSAGKRVSLTVNTVAIHNSPYIIPKKVVPTCTRDQDYCSICPLYVDEDEKIISPESPSILSMVDSNDSVQRSVISSELGVPSQCPVVQYECVEHYTIEDVRVSPTLNISSTDQQRTLQPAVCIGGDLELNETYNMIGRMHPHPSNQQATLVISKFKTANDALSNYKSKENDELKLFQPQDWTIEALTDHMKHLYNDLSANITDVHDRLGVHLVTDMVYHSPLLFPFGGKQQKGWADMMILGDSSQGKSEVVMNLQRFYNLGEKVECKNASVAGLLGGLQQLGKKWFVSWGVIPTQDRRLVVLEELKGTSTEVISKLTDMRSSGVAEIPKIEKRRTHARTRLLSLSNPRSNRVMSSYNFGVDAILELIGSPEDVRRFDFVLIVNQNDVDKSVINRKVKYPHEFTSELCRELILWTWTRHPEHVIFESQDYIRTKSTELTEKYTDRIPLLDRGSTRYKLARMASAVAARTFSTEDFHNLVVRNCHVDYVCEFIDEHYSSSTSGYLDYSKAVKLTESMSDESLITHNIKSLSFPKDFVENILYADTFDLTDICDWCELDRTDGQKVLSLLVRKRAIKRPGRKYIKNPAFIILLKNLLESGDLKSLSRPDFIPEKGEF